MLFEVKNEILSNAQIETWAHKELDIEKLIFNNPDVAAQIFQEDLLLLRRQKKNEGKRSDIIGVDPFGNGVIIELKKDGATLGVDTQALQYTALYGPYIGENFFNFVCDENSKVKKEDVESFLQVPIEKLNENTRIILIAKSFDPALFSMGRWLESKGIGFKCISFEPIEVNNQKYLNFSVAFSASPIDEYLFNSFQMPRHRKPSVFWHNIGISNQKWWDYLHKDEIITTSYSNQNNSYCIGYQKLHQYIKGDNIVAFASGVGALGYGEVLENCSTGYSYKDHGLKLPDAAGRHFHRLKVKWTDVLDFKNAITPQELRKIFKLNWPSGTKQTISDTAAVIDLIKEMRKREG